MRYYETLYIVNPNLENEALDITMGEIGTELEKSKSKIINHRVWGKKRLAYQIENQKYGSFILLQFEGGEQDQMNEFHTWMKLNNSVLRHMTVALDDKPEVYEEEVKEVPVEKIVRVEIPVEVIRKEIVHIPLYTQDKSLLKLAKNNAFDAADLEDQGLEKTGTEKKITENKNEARDE